MVLLVLVQVFIMLGFVLVVKIKNSIIVQVLFFVLVSLFFASSVFAGVSYVNTLGSNQSLGNNGLLFLDNTNAKVGIGTSSPTSALDIRGNQFQISPSGATSGQYPIVVWGNSSSITSPTAILISNSNTAVNTLSGIVFSDSSNKGVARILVNNTDQTGIGDLSFQTSAAAGAITTRMFIASGGNVGIGKTSPVAVLDVYANGVDALKVGKANAGNVLITEGQSAGVNDLVINRQTSGTWGSAGKTMLKFQNIEAGSSAWNIMQAYNDPDESGDFDSLVFEVDGTGSAYFAGSVGIGTSSPGARLHINASDGDTAFKFTTSTSGSTPRFSITGDETYGPYVYTNYGAVWYYGPTAWGGNRFSFRSSADLSNEKFVITETGKVGIGGATWSNNLPENTLTVRGNASITGNVGIGTTSPGTIFQVGEFGSNNLQGIRFDFFYRTGDPTRYGGADKISFNSNTGNGVMELASIAFKARSGSGGEKDGKLLFSASKDMEINGSGYPSADLVIDKNGNVGIGTSSPYYKLSVVPSAANTTGVNIVMGRNTNNNDYASLGFGDPDGVTIYNEIRAMRNAVASSYDLAFFYRNWGGPITEGMRISANGNVGVGTSSPQNKLEVALISNGSVTYPLSVSNKMHGAIGTGVGIDFHIHQDGYTDGYGGQIQVVSTGQDPNFINPYMAFLVSPTDSHTSPTEMMRITSSGNVGIGTSSPASMLSVFTSSAAAVPVAGIVRIGNYDYRAQTNKQVLSLAPGIFGIDLPGVGNGAFIVNENGKVGIGTNSPTEKFVVDGGAGTGGIKVRGYISGTGYEATSTFLDNYLGETRIYSAGSGGARGSFSINLVNASGGNYTSPLFITSAGNVGIGITSPGARLDVNDNITTLNSSGVVSFANSNNNVDSSPAVSYPVASFYRNGKVGTTFSSLLQIGISRWEVAGTAARTQADFMLLHGSNGGNPDITVMSLRSNGNVGIGTTSPDSMLNIKGDYNIHLEPSGGSPVNYYLTSNSANNIIGVNIRTKTGVWNVPNQSKASSGIDFSTYELDGSAGSINFGTRPAGEASTTLTSRMIILNNGNMGIGTTSPQDKLHVVMNSTSNGYGVSIAAVNSGGSGSQPAVAYLDSSNSRRWSAGIDVSSDSFRLTNASGITKFFINQAGNVGIGNTSPAQNLVVQSGGAWSRLNAGDSTFTASSSRSIKENIVPFNVGGVLDRVASVPVVTYDFKPEFCNNGGGCKDKLGLIAEDFYTVLGRGSDSSINGQDVSMALWLAVQELKKENDALKELVCEDHPGAEVCN